MLRGRYQHRDQRRPNLLLAVVLVAIEVGKEYRLYDQKRRYDQVRGVYEKSCRRKDRSRSANQSKILAKIIV